MIPVGVAEITVLADLSGTSRGDTPTWTDLSSFVLTSDTPIEGSWGRQSWLGDATAGECTIPLDNHDGRFTPGNTSSPYYPNVRNGVRFRVVVTVASIPVNMFDGYVNSWGVTFENGVYGLSSVACSDILALFLNDDSSQGWLTEECLLDSPSCLYPLQEDEGSASFGDLTSQQSPAVIVNSKYGAGVVDAGQSPDGTGLLNENVVTVTNAAYNTSTTKAAGSWLSAPIAAPVAPYTFEAWVQMPTSPPTGSNTATLLWQPVPNPASNTISLVLSATALNALVADSPAPFHFAEAGIAETYCDGNVHHFAFTMASDSKTLTLYVDGVAVGTGVAGVTLAAPVPTASIALGMQTTGMIGNAFTGAFAFLALYPTALSAGRVLAHYNAGALATPEGATVRTDQRLATLLALRANTGSSTDTGLGNMGQQDLTSESYGQALLDCGDVEGGIVWVDGSGLVRLRSRTHLFNPVPVLTLDAKQAQVSEDTTYDDDTQNQANKVIVSRPGGADQTVVNQASIDQVGIVEQSVTLPIDTDQNALAWAQWAVAVGSQEQESSEKLGTDLLTEPSTAFVLSALQVQPLDVVGQANLPGAAPASTVAYVAEGGSYNLGVNEFDVSWFTTPLPPSVLTSDGIVNGVAVPGDTSDSAIYVAAY